MATLLLLTTRFVRWLYLWACERLYAELAWSYDWVSWLVSLGAWSQWRATALNYIHGTTILEIGFGTGTLLTTMAQQGYTVVGLEYSPAMHRQAAAKLQRQGLCVPRVQAPSQQMPFATGNFDTIISTFPSHYIVDPATLAECKRLLCPPSPDSPSGRLVIVMGVTNVHTLWGVVLRFIFPQKATIAEHEDPLLARFADAGLSARYVKVPQGKAIVNLIIAEHYPEQPCT